MNKDDSRKFVQRWPWRAFRIILRISGVLVLLLLGGVLMLMKAQSAYEREDLPPSELAFSILNWGNVGQAINIQKILHHERLRANRVRGFCRFVAVELTPFDPSTLLSSTEADRRDGRYWQHLSELSPMVLDVVRQIVERVHAEGRDWFPDMEAIGSKDIVLKLRWGSLKHDKLLLGVLILYDIPSGRLYYAEVNELVK